MYCLLFVKNAPAWQVLCNDRPLAAQGAVQLGNAAILLGSPRCLGNVGVQVVVPPVVLDQSLVPRGGSITQQMNPFLIMPQY